MFSFLCLDSHSNDILEREISLASIRDKGQANSLKASLCRSHLSQKTFYKLRSHTFYFIQEFSY